MKCLFIGGPIDGERREVPEGQHALHVAERPRLSAAVSRPTYEADAAVTITRHTYYASPLRAGREGRWRLFIHEELSIEKALEALITRYPTPAP